MNIDLKDFKRFEKQIILKKVGINGQKKILNSKVLIVGLGGLGCPLLVYLANTGVGKIGIVDNDRVEVSNLNRQILFNASDIGKFKVNQAKKFINKIRIIIAYFISMVLIPRIELESDRYQRPVITIILYQLNLCNITKFFNEKKCN